MDVHDISVRYVKIKERGFPIISSSYLHTYELYNFLHITFTSGLCYENLNVYQYERSIIIVKL